METLNLNAFKNKILDALPVIGPSAAIKELKMGLSKSSQNYKTLVQLEIRLNDTVQDNLKGILSREQFELSKNKITASLIQVIGNINSNDFSDDSIGSTIKEIFATLDTPERNSMVMKIVMVLIVTIICLYIPDFSFIIACMLFPSLKEASFDGPLLLFFFILYFLSLLLWGISMYIIFYKRKKKYSIIKTHQNSSILDDNFTTTFTIANKEALFETWSTWSPKFKPKVLDSNL